MSTNKSFLILGAVIVIGVSASALQAIAGPSGGNSSARVMCTTITLDSSGDDKTVVFKALSDAIIQEVWVDNSPTRGLCQVVAGDGSEGGPVTCQESDFRIVHLSIMGSAFRPGNLPVCIAKSDSLSIRAMLDQDFDTRTSWPVTAGETVKLTLDADHEGCRTNEFMNDRRLRLCFGFFGKRDARLYLEE